LNRREKGINWQLELEKLKQWKLSRDEKFLLAERSKKSDEGKFSSAVPDFAFSISSQ